MRSDGRGNDELRPLSIKKNFMPNAEGSVLVEMGNTRVICTASIEDRVPRFLADSGTGWVTAEYAMLPRSTNTRKPRESSQGKVGGRTHEIQRLIGRSLRAVVNRNELGERTVWIDCDVIQADGGTRTASVTGGFICLAEALRHAHECGMIKSIPIVNSVAAISVGIVDGTPMLDLCYTEDFDAEVDMNVVMTGDGRFIEVQGTAEGYPFSLEEHDKLISLARGGIMQLIERIRPEVPGL